MEGIKVTYKGQTTFAAIDGAGVSFIIDVLPEYNYITLGGYDPKTDLHIGWFAKEMGAEDDIEMKYRKCQITMTCPIRKSLTGLRQSFQIKKRWKRLMSFCSQDMFLCGNT